MPGRQKPWEETQRGIKEAKKRANALKKQQKEDEKNRKKELYKQGLCIGPDGGIYTNAEVGKKFGSRAWNEASEEEKQSRMEQGKTAFSKMTAGEQDRIKNTGRMAFVNLDLPTREMIVQKGKEKGKEAWENPLQKNKKDGYRKGLTTGKI